MEYVFNIPKKIVYENLPELKEFVCVINHSTHLRFVIGESKVITLIGIRSSILCYCIALIIYCIGSP
jgi:hypothetical protein